RLGCNVSFISAIGGDQEGKYFLEACPHIDNSEILVCHDLQTAKYFSINVGGEVRFGISAIGNIVDRITPELISSREELISSADYVLFDSNIATRSINRIVELTKFYRKKATVLTSPLHVCDFVCANPQLMYNLDMLIVTLAAQGTAIISRDKNGSLRSSSLPPPLTSEKVLSVSGAGDSLNSGILAALAYRLPLEKCLQVGQRCAALTLQTVEAVSPQISPELLRI
ncbi:unnamed protein product, partial [Nippostrongylus brasiliensis]|uniref:PfkB domain-containing protein n=1 Tax=Nippostrongylus brasiliensis TaxID=27835 RepID=A0A0N4YX23_NIPBR